MADTPTITRSAQVETDLSQIRTAVYGREVREAIANGIEHCYDDNQAAIGNANEAITAANNAAKAANNAATAADQAKSRAENAAAAAENVNATASKVQDGPYQITVTNSQGASATIEIPDPAAEVKKKANLEAVTVKKTVGPAETVTFEDGVDAPAVLTKIKLEPKQDLHGYDHPWVGGMGKNLCPVIVSDTVSYEGYTAAPQQDGSIIVTGTWTGTSNAVLYKNSSGVDCQVKFQLPAGSYLVNGEDVSIYNNYGITLQIYNWDTESVLGRQTNSDLPITLESAATVGVRIYIISSKAVQPIPSDGVVIRPMIRLATEADYTYEPYSNICPIEGYDAVEVTRVGKNLLPRSAFPDRDGAGVTTTWNDDGTLHLECTSRTAENRWGLSAGQRVTHFTLSPGTYTLYRNITTTAYGFRIYNLSDSTNLPSLTKNQPDVETVNFTLDKTTNISTAITGSVGDSYDFDAKIGIFLADEFHNKWEPPMEDTYTVSLASAGTVYGGELTLNEDGSGNIVIDKKTVKFSDLTWGYNNTFGFRSMNQNSGNWDGLGNTTGGQDASQTCCSAYERRSIRSQAEAGEITYGYAIGSGISVYRLLLKDPRFGDDVDAFLEAMGNETVCYTLATPSDPIPLTAAQVQTLVGTNHVWTDAGEITLTYRSDKYAELERRINAQEQSAESLTTTVATLQADALATENGLSDITVGIESANSILPFYGEDGESVSKVTVTRKGHLITIDGTYTASARRRFNLFDIAGGNVPGLQPSSWYATERTPLESGKTYKIKARSVGGSISIPTAGNYGLNLQGLNTSGNIVLCLYDYGNGDLVCAPMLSNGSGLACLMLTVNQNVVFDNYKLYIDVIEVPEQINIAYISNADGSDINDGSKIHPFKTLNKAVETGYKKLCVAPDVYNENISINGGEFELLPWVDGQTFDSSVPYRPKIELIYGTKLTVSSAGNNIYTAPFTAASGTNMYKVFVDKTVSPTTQGSLALEYNVMLVGDRPNGTSGNNQKRLYTPVLTEGELTNQGTFYYDGTTVKFHPWDNVLDDNYYIPNDDALIGLSLQNMSKVHLEDVRIIGCYDYCAYLQECDSVTINACEFAYSGKGMGLGLDNCNARVSDCHASACSADGFNLHKYGYSEFYDCTSFYNGDDGISHHQGCTGIIDGGEWAYNGNGGITPAFGCSVDVQNVYCHHNLIGLQFLGSSGNRRSLRCTGCLLTDNSQSDLYAKYYDITSWNCAYGVKEIGSYATITEYNNKVIE